MSDPPSQAQTPPPAAASGPTDQALGLGVRILYMLLFAIAFWMVCWALGITAVVQLIVRLLQGHAHEDLKRFGAALARYAAQIVAFMTFASDRAPFPFSDWPRTRGGTTPDDLSGL